MFSDFLLVGFWWLTIFCIGIIYFPLTKKIFGSFFDKGYLFSKVLGILLSSYLVWLLASLKILPFFRESILLVLILGLVGNLLLFKKGWLPTKELKRVLPILAGEEILFFGALLLWSFVRGLQPDIQGLEKFMDFGFISSILRSKYFPPADMWFAGESINYYYFGHFVTGFLTKLTGINPAVTYNLMIATLFGFCFSLTFSLAGNLIYFFHNEKAKNLKYIVFGGVISALLISLGANLHPAFYNFKMGVLKIPYCDGMTSYWYPNATRYIGYCPNVDDKTIHEFPSYSFIVSDLHGHVSDIPFVITILALIFLLYIKVKEKKISSLSEVLPLVFLLSILFAATYMTNQWDYPVYLLVLGVGLLSSYSQQFGISFKTLKKTAVFSLLILLLSLPFLVPFQLSFENIAQGVGFVRAHSLFYQLLILWGVPWFFGLTFIFFLALKKRKKEFRIISSDLFVLVLVFVSTVLIIVPEIIYLKDIYIPSYHRANTMFKLTYQSFIMFSISVGYIVTRVLSSIKKNLFKKTISIVYFLAILLLLIYPFYSIKGYYGNFSFSNYKGLYGFNFLKRLYPDDYQTILWLNKNIQGQPVILEAVGDSYTDYGRISMATGLPTVEGWLVHEWLWRGGFDEPGKRSREVQIIYESEDLGQTKQLLNKYQVKYVILGQMERQKYPNINEDKIKSLGEKVFESNTTAVYKLF